MERLFFVTGNVNKFNEVKRMLAKVDIEVFQSDLPIVERKYPTEKEVSISKALSAVREIKAPVIVEDTGIYFEAYNNFPGPNAHVVFSGIGYDGILKLLEGKERKAFFRTSVAYCRPNEAPITFIGECPGRITESVSDVIDFDYDAIFIPDGDSRTFSEMGMEEKERYSHRRKAVEEFMKWYKQNRH